MLPRYFPPTHSACNAHTTSIKWQPDAGTPIVTGSGTSCSPRPNFPLPAELRNKIYGYILDGDYAVSDSYAKRYGMLVDNDQIDIEKRGRKLNPAHTYDFCTSILRVNREINREATGIFYYTNCFVSVHIIWDKLGLYDHWYGLPMIADRIEHFKGAMFEICIIDRKLAPQGCSAGNENSSQFIMLGRDLKHLCRTMQWLTMTKHAEMIALDEFGRAVSIPRSNGPPIETNAFFRLQGEAPAKAAMLVGSLLQLSIPGQKITVLGDGPNASVKGMPISSLFQVRESMDSMVFADPMLRWMLEEFELEKTRADEMLHKGEWLSAYLRYCSMIRECAKWPIFERHEWEEGVGKGRRYMPMFVLRHLVLGVSTTACALSLNNLAHLSWTDVAMCDDCWESMAFVLQILSDSPTMRFHGLRSAPMLAALQNAIYASEPADLEDSIACLEDCAIISPHDEDLAHDLEFLRQLQADPSMQNIFDGDDSSNQIWQNLRLCRRKAPIWGPRKLIDNSG